MHFFYPLPTKSGAPPGDPRPPGTLLRSLAEIRFFLYTDMKLPHTHMEHRSPSGHLSRTSRVVTHVVTVASLALASILPQVASAASSWKPTLLVNTESFQTIDEGDGTTDVEVRFGGSLNEIFRWNRARGTFQVTDDLSVQGTLSGTALVVNKDANIGGTLSVSGAILGVSSITSRSFLSGALLRVSGPAEIHGALNASGAIRTDSNLTLNADIDGNDVVLTFGSDSVSETMTWLNSADKFQLSDDLSVLGTISGSVLRIDGNAQVQSLSASGTIRTEGAISGATLNIGGQLTLRNQTYNAPTSQAVGVLTNDGAGNLTWSATSIGNGSGLIMSMHPEYPNAIYFSSGASYIGQLYGSGGTTALDNSYVWTSTRATIQDYWISVRFRIPDNFSSWDVVKPIQFRYKTGDGTAGNNHVTVRLRDTAGAEVALTGGGGLANAAWTTASITGPESAGTWTPKGYATLYVKLASLTGGNAAAGFVNLNYETTTP